MKNSKITVAEMIAHKLKARGVQRMFGIPGGGSNLDLIDSAAKHGIEFHLSKREDSAVMMAAVTAEMSGTPGVVLTTKGPGTASAVNGVAYASLDRTPDDVF
ncbi:MAG: thiamine pyrophosphate-binding protein, partial [Rhodospirillales bacterium]